MLCKEFGYTKEDQEEFALLSKKKFCDRTIIDTVARNAREPQRKMKAGERIMGPLLLLDQYGAVSEPVAKAMAEGARKALEADIAVSVTGLAGPTGDEYGNPVGTVFIGYSDGDQRAVKHCLFSGDRESIRNQTIGEALKLILTMQTQ